MAATQKKESVLDDPEQTDRRQRKKKRHLEQTDTAPSGGAKQGSAAPQCLAAEQRRRAGTARCGRRTHARTGGGRRPVLISCHGKEKRRTELCMSIELGPKGYIYMGHPKP